MAANQLARLLLVVAVPFALTGCKTAASAGQGMPQMPSPSVELRTLSQEPVTESSAFMGYFKSRKNAVIQPRIAGHVKEIYVSSGTYVTAGAPLMLIDPDRQQATISASSAASESNAAAKENAVHSLDSLKAMKASREANLRLAKAQLDRYQQLCAEGAVSQESVDICKNKSEVAQSELDAIEHDLRAKESEIEKLARTYKQSQSVLQEEKVQLQYHTIRAPFAGIIGDVPPRLGEYVTTDTLLTTVTQNQPLEVNISVPAHFSGRLHAGMKVQLFTDEPTPDTAVVTFIAPQVSNEDQGLLVKAAYQNKNKRARVGQLVSTRLIWETHSGLLVPTIAVSHTSGQDFVFVAEKKDGKWVARQKPVKLGDIDGQRYAVLSGLKAGEQIVTSGIQSLSDGLTIQPASGS